ncbi:MAG: hypothetical protein QM755_02660 [Luteolibacter sp.]
MAALLKDENPFIAARAVWLLAQMGPAGAAKVTPLLASADEQQRLVAYRALRRAGQDVVAMGRKMAADPSAAVRREVAISMRDVPLDQSREILVEIARRFDGKDRSYLEAFGTGCDSKARDIQAALVPLLGAPAEQWSEAYAWITWRLGSPDAVADLKTRALSAKLSSVQRKLAMDTMGFIPSQEAAMGMLDLATDTQFPHRDMALWWLNNRRGDQWKPYDLTPLMKQRGLLDEKPLVSIISPEPPKESKLPPLAKIIELKGDVERGRVASTACFVCHKIGAQGMDLGPGLTAFGKTQTKEVIIESILTPSAEISHGYEGRRLETKDGIIIEGIVTSSSDPVIIKSMGGQSQSVSKDRIKSNTPLGHSLMWNADTLGLTAQSLADIAAYLKSDVVK